jgi:hypothetical protein
MLRVASNRCQATRFRRRCPYGAGVAAGEPIGLAIGLATGLATADAACDATATIVGAVCVMSETTVGGGATVGSMVAVVPGAAVGATAVPPQAWSAKRTIGAAAMTNAARLNVRGRAAARRVVESLAIESPFPVTRPNPDGRAPSRSGV